MKKIILLEWINTMEVEIRVIEVNNTWKIMVLLADSHWM